MVVQEARMEDRSRHWVKRGLRERRPQRSFAQWEAEKLGVRNMVRKGEGVSSYIFKPPVNGGCVVRETAF